MFPNTILIVDRDKAKAFRITLSEIFNTLQTQLGSFHVNDFNKFGRTYQVKLQAESEFRATPSDLPRFYVRNSKNEIVPLPTVATLKSVLGPDSITHYNLYCSAKVSGQAAEGYSSGDVLNTMIRLAKNLPDDYTSE